MSKHRLVFGNDISDSSQTRIMKSTEIVYQDSESDSDIDMKNEFDLGLSGKLPYTVEEDEYILNFVLKGQNIFKTSSLSLWKHLESKKEKPIRTYQSLKNRFLRNIKPNIFTTFIRLVKDEETTKKILLKFPELIKSHDRAMLSLNVPSRNKTDSTSAEHKTSEDENYPIVEIKCEKNAREENVLSQAKPKRTEIIQNCSEDLTSLKKIKFMETLSETVFDSDHYMREIEFDKNSKIVVTFQNNLFLEASKRNNLGIYEKFLKLKARNKISQCQFCGRGGREIDIINGNNDNKSNSIDNKNESDVEVIGFYHPKKVDNLVGNSVSEEQLIKVEKRTPSKEKNLEENNSQSLLSDVSPSEGKESLSKLILQNHEVNSPFLSGDKNKKGDSNSVDQVSRYPLRKNNFEVK